MSGSGIAVRYARALVGLSDDPGAVPRLLEELELLTDTILESQDLVRVLLTPIHPRHERRGVIAELCRKLELSDELRAFSEVLVGQHRMHELAAIRDALRELVDRAAGRLTAQVRSARPLDPAQLDELRRTLSRRVGSQVTLETEVDPALLGGVVARVGDLLLDGSVRTQLATLGSNLKKGSE